MTEYGLGVIAEAAKKEKRAKELASHMDDLDLLVNSSDEMVRNTARLKKQSIDALSPADIYFKAQAIRNQRNYQQI